MAEETSNVSRRTFLTTAGASVGALALAGCTESNDGGNQNGGGGGDSGELSGTIDIAGSSTVFPLATAVQEAFNEDHPEVDISISSTGSGGGFANFFCKGETDFNNASRPMKESEKKQCRENGVEWHEIEVATDALTVIVNNDADWLDSITVEELKQIWEPDGATNWSDVNSEWPDEEIKLFGPTSASGTFDYFTEVVIGESGASRKDYSATENDRQIIRGVEGSQYAMGYLGFAYYSENMDVVKGLAIDDGDGEPVEPSLDNAKSGAYTPLARPLFTYPSIESLQEDHIAAFARFFVEQSANQDLVANEVGYVPKSEEEMQAQLDALNEAIDSA